MGSRAKKGRPKKPSPDWRVKKLIFYGILTVVILGVIWYLVLFSPQGAPLRRIPASSPRSGAP